MQEVTLADDQVIVEDPPLVTLVGLVEIEAEGVGPEQACVLQDWLDEPEQFAPPLEGGGFVQVLVCVPPPQEALQVLQELQPPFTGVDPDGAQSAFALH